MTDSSSAGSVGDRSLRIHTERTPDDSTMSWIVRDNMVAGRATVTAEHRPANMPPTIAALVDEGVVARIEVADGSIRVWRPAGNDSWSGLAQRVDAAIRNGLAAGAWVIEDEPGADATNADAELASGVRELLDGDLGEYIASHGGRIELLAVTDGAVKLKLTGACQGCPASTHTLRIGIESRLRTRFPQLTCVEATS